MVVNKIVGERPESILSNSWCFWVFDALIALAGVAGCTACCCCCSKKMKNQKARLESEKKAD